MANVVVVPIPSRQAGQIVSAKYLRHRIPKAARRAFERARKLSRAGDAEKATKELERAIALDPEFAQAHNNLGVLYAGLARYREAEAQFRLAIGLRPEDSLAHFNLAMVVLH